MRNKAFGMVHLMTGGAVSEECSPGGGGGLPKVAAQKPTGHVAHHTRARTPWVREAKRHPG